MGTDYIDRDLMSAAARRGSAAAASSRRPSAEERQAEIDDLNEREAALLAEKQAILELQEKQTTYSEMREELDAALSAAIERVGNAHVSLTTVLEILEKAENDLNELDARLSAIQEEAWSDEELEQELTKAIDAIGDYRNSYNEIAARLQDAGEACRQVGLSEESDKPRSLGGWLSNWGARAKEGWAWGLAAALPMLIVAALVSLGWWIFLSWWW